MEAPVSRSWAHSFTWKVLFYTLVSIVNNAREKVNCAGGLQRIVD